MDQLRARYPRAAAYLASVPNPRVAAPAPFWWSVVAAAGAASLASAGVTMFFAIVLRGFGAYPSSFADGLAAAAALATGLGVAFVAEGVDALWTYAGIVALVRILSAAAAFRACATIIAIDSPCSFFGYLFGLWPYVVGGGAGYVCVRWFRRREGNGNPLLEALGAVALAETVLISADSFLFPAPSSFEGGALGLAVLVVAGLACGQVLLRRVAEPRQWTVLGMVALVIIGPWLLKELPAFIGQIGVAGHMPLGPLQLMLFLRPFVELFAVATVLYIAAARKATAPASPAA